MALFNPFARAVEMQRGLIQESRQAVKTGINIQHMMGRSAVNSIERSGELQRDFLEWQYKHIRRAMKNSDEGLPGVKVPQDMLTTVDKQAAEIYGDQVEAFERLTSELEQSVETYEDATIESMDVIDDHLEDIITALEEVEETANGDVPVPLPVDIEGADSIGN